MMPAASSRPVAADRVVTLKLPNNCSPHTQPNICSPRTPKKLTKKCHTRSGIGQYWSFVEHAQAYGCRPFPVYSNNPFQSTKHMSLMICECFRNRARGQEGGPRVALRAPPRRALPARPMFARRVDNDHPVPSRPRSGIAGSASSRHGGGTTFVQIQGLSHHVIELFVGCVYI